MVIAERYKLERPVGTGGMATIWEGMHLALNRPIAIKFIDIVGPNSAKVRGRFLREARVAAAVQHRNVVDIVDFGTTEDGRPFMVMELLVGRTLADRMGDVDPISVGEAVRIVAQVLSGLAAVHDAGIVHRDLKPENIFLTADADGTYPKVLDFGVSRAVDPRGDLKSVLPTVENAIVGTPQYMSPEQARGLREMDHRSDLWSTGVMLYELLTGQLPYDSDAVGDIIIQIATAEPPDFRSLRPDLAGPVEHVIKKAMARKPDDRYASAREMRQALLSAVAQTAAEIQGASARQGQARLETDSDLPPVAAQELMSAVGDAYEPGDSGLIDFSDHIGSILFEDEPSSGLRAVPPPPKRGAADPFAAAATLDAVESQGASQDAKGRGRGLRVALVITSLLAAGGAGAWWMLDQRGVDVAGWAGFDAPGTSATPLAPGPEVQPPPTEAEGAETPIAAAPPPEGQALGAEGAGLGSEQDAAEAEGAAPEPPAHVAVTLEGVPAGAEVLVDGEAVEGAGPYEIARDDAEHTLEVRAGRGRTWSATHVASDDGAYTVELPLSARERRIRRIRARRARQSREARPRDSRDLIRDPGF